MSIKLLMTLSGTAAETQSAGPRGVQAGANDNSAGSIAWTNPGNVTSSNNARAIATNGVASSTAITNWLEATNPGFTSDELPDNASIMSVLVEVECSQTALISPDQVATWSDVRLIKGGVILTDNAAADQVLPDGNAKEGYQAFVFSGNDALGLKPADVRASDFGVSLQSQIVTADAETGGSNAARVDHIRLTVFFTIRTGPRAIRHRRRGRLRLRGSIAVR